jgi:hypothetical protein
VFTGNGGNRGEKIFQTYNQLINCSVKIDVEGEKKRVYAVLAFVNGDNLARHALFGFNESFSLAKKPCATCNATQEEVQTMFVEDQSKIVRKGSIHI